MVFSPKIINLLFSHRHSEIERFKQHPFEVQQEQLEYLLKHGRNSVFGRDHNLAEVRTLDDFQRNVPAFDYDSFDKYILRSKGGEDFVVWDTKISWFAKSSGTTGAKSKYIPVTNEGLLHSHMRGPRDVMAMFTHNNPNSNLFAGKTLTLGGSRRIEHEGERVLSGDLSAILIENTPWWANWRRMPSVKTALIPDFEQKVALICKDAVKENVTNFAGVPSWNLVMMNKILDYTGKNNLLEVWPNMELFVHGGMSFKPYRDEYLKLIPSAQMKYMETYNASEGFFAIADDPTRDDMLLMLDYMTFYEFLPVGSLDDISKAIPLEGVKQGINYAMIITSCNGLWRYMIGDTVEFTSVSPFRIKITGRTKHFINVFGEEVMVDNAESAVFAACRETGASVAEFSVAPIFMEGRSKGAHQWVVEFRTEPDSLDNFVQQLDRELQGVNSDYEAKRFKDTTLMPPHVSVVPQGTFLRWMERKGKVGGQNKVPRLSNERAYIEQLLEIANNM